MPRQILVVCEDAGGASALAPVARKLIERGDKVVFHLGPVASRTFQQRGVAGNAEIFDGDPSRYPLTEAESARADVVLTSSSCWGQRLEARATIAARTRATPSVAVIDFWSNYEARLSFPDTAGLAALPDRITVIDATMRDEIVALGVDREKLIVTGSPAFDEALSRRRERRQRAGHVLFLSQPLAALYGADESAAGFLGYTERSVLAVVASAMRNAAIDLVVRPHPREDADQLRDFVQKLDCVARVDNTGSLDNAVTAARLVIGMTTVGLVEAAILGAPCISAQLDLRGSDPLVTNRNGLTVAAYNADDLHCVIEKGLDGTLPIPPGAPWMAGATERVLAVVDSVMSPADAGEKSPVR